MTDMDDNEPDVSNDLGSVGLGCALEAFKEYDEVQKIIDNINDVFDNLTLSEAACQRFKYILNQYQEQPHLLDPYLDTLLDELLSKARKASVHRSLRHLAFQFLYIITKVRGFKVVIRHLPHEVSDVEKILKLLEEEDPQDCDSWQTRYMLLLWLSIAVMIPFDMHRLDNTSATADGDKPIMCRILDVVKLYLSVGDKARDAAAFLASHFVNRPDVKCLYFEEFLEWSLQTLVETDICTMSGLSLQAGILSSLSLIFKHGKREDIKGHGTRVLKKILDCGFSHNKSTVVRKMFLKLIQRIGLTFLKVRLANWRYSRGTRCLADNLAEDDALSNHAVDDSEESDEAYDVPDEIEDIIEQLLVGLRDKDTVLRWSAAKGIGRITSRLPKELADDVVTSLLELFNLRESDSAWHGGCLALAELGRRGLILPQHLNETVNVVMKALVYDELRGNFSVGAHIRDAACYVCWSFARAYDPQALEPYVSSIAGALLVTAVFDREVNCRRAASAAFQENVGRQGTFPHGIEILTYADYYAVGYRSNAFLNISAFIGGFPEYSVTLINHLLEHKVSHWDSAVRELSSKALHNLTLKNHQYVSSHILPKLLSWTVGMDLNARHGSILAVAEIVHALSTNAKNECGELNTILGDSVKQHMRSIVFTLKSKRLFRGLGGVLTLRAVNMLIGRVSETAVLFHDDDELIAAWQEVLDISLQHAEVAVRSSAVIALPHFCSSYVFETSKALAFLQHFLSQLKANHMEYRCGYALAIGCLPHFMFKDHLSDVLNALSETASLYGEHASWAEARRDAVKALAQVARTHADAPELLPSPSIQALYDTLLTAMDDYTIDSRGEIGAIVREAAMQAIYEVTSLVCENTPELLTTDLISRIFSSILQQCVEKIDRTRSVAGTVFSAFLHNASLHPYLDCCDEIMKTFPAKICDEINWAAPSDTFHRFVQLLPLKKFTYNLLMGFTVSVGGLSESLVKYSRSALVAYLTSLTAEDELWFHIAETLIMILENNMKNDRILIPLFKMMNYLFISGIVFPNYSQETFFNEQLVDLVWQSSCRSSDPQKIFAAIDLFCDSMQFDEPCRRKCLTKLTIFLCHRFPRIRIVTASKMYEAFVSYDFLANSELDEVLNVLSETDWNQPVDILRPIRNGLCEKLCVPVPCRKKC